MLRNSHYLELNFTSGNTFLVTANTTHNYKRFNFYNLIFPATVFLISYYFNRFQSSTKNTELKFYSIKWGGRLRNNSFDELLLLFLDRSPYSSNLGDKSRRQSGSRFREETETTIRLNVKRVHAHRAPRIKASFAEIVANHRLQRKRRIGRKKGSWKRNPSPRKARRLSSLFVLIYARPFSV